MAVTHASPGKVLYHIDFTEQPNGPAINWLKKNGFEPSLEASKLHPYFQNGRLVFQTKGEVAGLFSKRLNLPHANRIRIYWGVERYPQGADWENGIIAVPIAIMISFGVTKIDSGAFYIPDEPFFIGIFLGEKEKEDKTYTGRYYKKGGRYFCQPCGVLPGETVLTDFDLAGTFQREFPEIAMPPVSSFDFQMNTKHTTGGASAFLEKVEFLSE